MSDKNDALLYHYTDWTALRGILTEGKFWASDWRMLNDTTEFKLGREILREVIENELDLCRSTSAKAKRIEQIRDAVVSIESGIADGAQSLFVTSFTEAGDDLGQWRSYASDGRGVSIGFTRATLREAGGAFRQVEYDEVRHRRKLRTALQTQLGKPTTNDVLLTAKANALIRVCLSYKHSGFASEREHRLISTVSSSLKFRSVADAVIPYREFPMKRIDPENEASPPAIAEILIGPRSHAAAEGTLRTLLRVVYGEETPPVTRSTIPYR